MFGLFFCQKYCNLSCCKSASKQNRVFMKNAQNHVNCEVKPNFGKKQLETKSVPIAFSIGFSQSSHTLHVLYQKSSFCVESNKTLQKCSQNPFFGASSPSKNHPWNAFFSPDHKKRKGRYLRPFIILMFVSPGHKHFGTSHINLRKIPNTCCTWHFSCAFLSSPPPLSPKSMGGMLDIVSMFWS